MLLQQDILTYVKWSDLYFMLPMVAASDDKFSVIPIESGIEPLTVALHMLVRRLDIYPRCFLFYNAWASTVVSYRT